MAEEQEILLDEQVETGDPKPKLRDQDRVRLDAIVQKMVRNREPDAAIRAVVADFKKKYMVLSSPKEMPAIPKPVIPKAQPKEPQLWDYGFEKTEPVTLPAVDYSQPVTEAKIKETVQTVPGIEAQKGKAREETAIRFGGEISKAQKALYDALTGNDDVITKIIKGERYDKAAQQQIDQFANAPRSDMPGVQSAALQVDPRVEQPTAPQDLPVTSDDIEKEKQKIATDELRARNVLEEVARVKPEKSGQIQSSLYKLDIANSLTEQDVNKRLPKILQNAKDLEKGNLIYNPRNGQLVKPENIFQSFKTAWKHKEQSYEDFERFRKVENNEAIAMDLDKRLADRDPDEAIPVPEGVLGSLGGALGGMPLKVYAAGAAGSLGGPGGAALAASGVGAREAFKLGWANEFQRAYYELRQQGVSGFEAVEKARQQADNAANIDAVVGGVSGLIAARIPYRQMTAVNFSNGFRKSLVSALKGYGQVLSPALKEGIAAGGIAAAGETYKNELAKEAGINRDATENVLEVAEMNLLIPLAIGAVTGAAKISKSGYNHLMQGLHNIPEGIFNNALTEAVGNRIITEEQAASVKEQVSEYGKVDSSIPENVAPEARVEIQGLIERRNKLETQLQNTDKAFHPEIKERIKVIEEQINEKSKERVKPDKDQQENKRLIEEGIAEELAGFNGVLKDIAQNDPTGFMKFVADQALGRNSDGSASLRPEVESVAREQFGDAVVDKALKMFPLEQPKPKVTVSTPIIRNVRAKEGAIPDIDIQYEGGKPTGNLLQGKELIAEGSESTVYRDGDTVIKVSEPYNDPSTFNQRVEDARIISDVLGDGSLEVIGSYKSKNGTPNPVFRQKFIEGEKATPEQIDVYMESKGFQKKNGGWENDQYRFTDIDSDNAIVDADGNVHIIDAGVKKLKSTQDAVEIEIANAMDVGQQARDGKGMGQRDTQSESTTRESTTEENKGANEGPEMIGITHQKMDEMSRRLGFPEYEKGPEKQTEWIEQAKQRIAKDPNAIPDLIERLRNGAIPDPVEQKMMAIYVVDLDAKLQKDPYNDALLDTLNRAKNLSNIAGGRLPAQTLAARKGLYPSEETLGDFYEQQQAATKSSILTKKQKDTNIKEFQDIKDAEGAYNAKVDEAKTKQQTDAAEQVIKEEKQKAKKSPKKDYAKERKQIFADIQQKLKDARKDTQVTVVPYAKELFAIAPDVAKLVRSLVEEGIDKLPNVIDRVHETLKEFIEPITKEDVRALIAGDYNKKVTRSDIAAKIRDLKTEAGLIGQLQQLEAGVVPKSERAQQRRNQRIEELRKQIRENNLKQMDTARKRMEKEIAELEAKLAAGDYSKPEKKELVLDRETQRLKDRLIQLRKEREIRLAQEEYQNRPLWKKYMDYALIPVRELRTLWSSFDLSMPGRQGIIPTAAELLTNPGATKQRMGKMMEYFGNEKGFDRYMYDLKNSEDFPLMEKSKLAITEPGKFDKKEEVFQSRYIEKIPGFGTIGIKGSERAAAFWLNDQRVKLFREGVRMMQDNGRTFENSEQAYKNWASFVNSITGRGELVGPFKNAAEGLSAIFFSPKLMASRLAIFNPMFYAKVPKELRLRVAGDMAKFLAFGTTIVGLSGLFGADTETDPRSADFGKIKVGNTRYDMWGGHQQYMRLFANILSGKKTAGGKIVPTWEKDRQGEFKAAKIGIDFLRSKSSPVVGTIWDIAAGENIVGQEVTVNTELGKLMPLVAKDMVEAIKKEGGEGVLKTLPAIFGIGVSTYGGDSGKSSSDKSKKKTQKYN